MNKRSSTSRKHVVNRCHRLPASLARAYQASLADANGFSSRARTVPMNNDEGQGDKQRADGAPTLQRMNEDTTGSARRLPARVLDVGS